MGVQLFIVLPKFIVGGGRVRTMAHILIVEDEESIQVLIHTILKSAHHSVSQAHDGGAAFDLLDRGSEPVELIILDLFMPKMDGFEFLLILQKQTFRFPGVILSAFSEKNP